MARKKKDEVQLTADEQFVMDEISSVKEIYDGLLGLAVSAVESEIDGAVKSHDTLYSLVTDGVANVLGDSGETLQELTRLVDVANGFVAEAAAMAENTTTNSTNDTNDEYEEYLADLRRRGLDQYTPKQLLWYFWRLLAVETWSNRRNRLPDNSGDVPVHIQDIRITEQVLDLRPKPTLIPPGVATVTYIRIPTHDEITIYLPSGVPIE